MRAIVATAVGGPEVLELRELPTPEPGPGEVTIAVAFAGVNFAEVMGRRGDLGPMPEPFVPGLEVAGRVCAVGPDTEGFRVGDPVCAFTDVGGYAEVVRTKAQLAFPLADDSRESLLRAACSPTIAITAWSLLARTARLGRGETVVAHAAAGGLGTMAVQFARALGAGRIIGTVGRASKVAYARDLGYDDVIERNGFPERVRELTGGRGADVVLDSIGGDVREQSLEALAPYGRLVLCGNASQADDVTFGAGALMPRNAAIAGYSIGWLAQTNPELVNEAGRYALAPIERGEMRLDVAEVLALADAADVHRRLEAGATTGKLALEVSP